MPRAGRRVLGDKEQALGGASDWANVECRGAPACCCRRLPRIGQQSERDIQTDEDRHLPCRRREHTANNQHITYPFKA
jgi:hypothetical protein